MTQFFGSDGELIGVTAVELGPCVVTQRKTKERDGYDAVQLGFLTAKEQRVTKPLKGHFKKAAKGLFRYTREFRLDADENLDVGQTLTANVFEPGDMVHVSGITKGRGFQGVIKRHGKHGGPASHGSDFHRQTGSIGMRTSPHRVPKNMKMPGQMGVDRVTTKNVEVVAVHQEAHIVFIRGAVPGPRDGLVEVVAVKKRFS